MISGLLCQISFWPWFHNTTVTTKTISLPLNLEDDSRTNRVRHMLLIVLVVVVSPIAQIGYGYRELEAKFALQWIDHAPSSNCLFIETQPRFWRAQRAAYAVYPPKSSAICAKMREKNLIGQAAEDESIRRRICNLPPSETSTHAPTSPILDQL